MSVRNLILCLFTAPILIIAGCSESTGDPSVIPTEPKGASFPPQAESSKNNSKPAVNSAPKVENSDHSEARAAAEAEFYKLFVPVPSRDSVVVGVRDTRILEFKSIRATVEPFQPLTKADELNGITWKGRVRFLAAALREHDGKAWGSWQDVGKPLQVYELSKSNEAWTIAAAGVADKLIFIGTLSKPTDIEGARVLIREEAVIARESAVKRWLAVEPFHNVAKEKLGIGRKALTELVDAYKAADRSNSFPLMWNGLKLDKATSRRQILKLAGDVDGQQMLLSQLETIHNQSGAIDQARTDATSRLDKIDGEPMAELVHLEIRRFRDTLAQFKSAQLPTPPNVTFSDEDFDRIISR